MFLGKKFSPMSALFTFFLFGALCTASAESSKPNEQNTDSAELNKAEVEKASQEISAMDQSLENAFKEHNLAQYTTIYDTARQKAESVVNKSKSLGEKTSLEISKFFKNWDADKRKKIDELKKKPD